VPCEVYVLSLYSDCQPPETGVTSLRTSTPGERLRILHLEDDDADGELVVLALSEAVPAPEVTRVGTYAAFLKALESPSYGLVLCDYSLPDFDGLTALALTRKALPDVPFIFVSGTIGEDRAVEALRMGATDYILKDRLSRLPSAVARALREHEDRGARRAAEDRVREQAALLDEARESIIVQGLDRKVTYWSRGAEHLYGWSADEAAAGLAEARFPLSAQVETDAAWEAVTTTGKWDGQFKHLTREGLEIVVESHWTCLRHPDGAPRAILSISSDVTQARRLEGQLLRAQRLEAVGMIASGVAHDLNNVLAPILIGIGSLKRKVADEHAQRLLGAMEVSAERGSDIVRQVLTFVRGAVQPGTPIDMGTLMREGEALVSAMLPDTIVFETKVSPDLRKTTGDATQLQQVLLNLCVNARDAMPQGGRLTLEARNLSLTGARAGEFVEIRVSDTGPGVPKDLQGRIFEPFFTTKKDGTGIGLSTILAIVKRHGGYIDVQSDPGQGAEFRVLLPAVEEAAAPPAEPGARGAGGVLLVVDEGAVREILRETLGAWGYRVLGAETLPQAVGEYVRHRDEIGAVLANLSMPGLDGAALVDELAARDPTVKLIDTGGGGAPPRGVVRAALTKPYSADALLDTVHRVLESS
jgi:PAS domain S-box-containing protein